MEVDHFNPKKKTDLIQKYSNLFLSTRHCNGAKRDRWPTNREKRAGARFLNCCNEMDYGVHIFEDPDNHELVGITPEGRYHVRNCDLNAPHLVEERTERAEILKMLGNKGILYKRRDWSLPVQTSALKAVAEKMIPLIPYLAGVALEKRRAVRKALATP